MSNFLPPSKVRLIDREGDINGPWLLWVEQVARRLDDVTDIAASVDPPSIPPGGMVQVTVTVGDAAPGDFARATFRPPDAGVIVSADVTGDNQVTATFNNISAAPIDLPAGTLFLRMERRR